MPPKESAKKPPPPMVRPPISNSSLVYIPEDVIEGFQERLKTGVDWIDVELASRHHKKMCAEEETPTFTFSEALKTKIDNSIFGGFLNKESSIPFDQHWELLLPITLWENEKFANEEGKICFRNANNITDDMVKMIKKAVHLGDREVLRKDIKMVYVLRLIGAKMAILDKGLKDFKNLISLNLCGNYLKEINSSVIPRCVRSIELQGNFIKNVDQFAEQLPEELLYLGLGRNLLNDESIEGMTRLPHSIAVLDLSDNDISDLDRLLDVLFSLPSLTSLSLAGNPCSVCMGYARTTLKRLPRLIWLDSREAIPTDRSPDIIAPHPDDLRSAHFHFTIFRVMSAPEPPKPEKGVVATFHIELELPLLDSERRQFLMFRRHESLIETLPAPEDEEWPPTMSLKHIESRLVSSPGIEEASSHESDVYKILTTKNSREVCHFQTFESNRVQWNKIMNFTEPAVKIFCPDLVALRNTFRTVVTIRLVYSLTNTAKPAKTDKKSSVSLKPIGEQRVILATIKCALRRPDWSQLSQHFHWDDSLGTNEAIHWGDGNLSVLQYSQAPPKVTKSKSGHTLVDSRLQPPDNLTCHFGFGIDTLGEGGLKRVI